MEIVRSSIDSRNDPVTAVSGAEIGWRPKGEQREIRKPFDGASVARMTGLSGTERILERYENRKWDIAYEIKHSILYMILYSETNPICCIPA